MKKTINNLLDSDITGNLTIHNDNDKNITSLEIQHNNIFIKETRKKYSSSGVTHKVIKILEVEGDFSSPTHKEKIIRELNGNGFSQTEIGKRLGISQQSVSRILKTSKNLFRPFED
ncbi:MAG: hypothetical protein ACRC6T_08310 [Sarcina sp.]